MNRVTLWGDIAIKFRFMGIDLGYQKRTIDHGQGPIVMSPIPFTNTLPFQFNKFGVRLNIFIGPA